MSVAPTPRRSRDAPLASGTLDGLRLSGAVSTLHKTMGGAVQVSVKYGTTTAEVTVTYDAEELTALWKYDLWKLQLLDNFRPITNSHEQYDRKKNHLDPFKEPEHIKAGAFRTGPLTIYRSNHIELTKAVEQLKANLAYLKSKIEDGPPENDEFEI